MTPFPFMPTHLSVSEAARAFGVGETTFLELVKAGVAPQPTWIGRRKVWNSWLLAEKINAMSGIGTDRPGKTWSDVG